MRQMMLILLLVISSVSQGQTMEQASVAQSKMSTSERYVSDLYSHLFFRPADPEGLTYWSQALRQRGCGAVVREFLNSTENRRGQHLREMGPGSIDYFPRYLRVLYVLVLRRQADQVGFNYWMSRYYAGASIQQIEEAFVNSDELNQVCANISR